MPDMLNAVVMEMLSQWLRREIFTGISLPRGKTKEFKDARTKRDKETAQRNARMKLIVEQAATELHPMLEQTRRETGEDYSQLFSHPPFLDAVTQVLLNDPTLDLDDVRFSFRAMLGNEVWADMSELLDLFFARLKLLLAMDSLWGPVLNELHREAQQAKLDESALQMAMMAEQLAKSIFSINRGKWFGCTIFVLGRSG